MADIWVKIAIGMLKGLSFIYDVVTFLPYYLLDNPTSKLATSCRIKARPTRPGDCSSPYRSVESYKALTVCQVSGCESLDELFIHAVSLYTNCPCLGTRLLLDEQDEVQPNGKVFKKSIYGEYLWLTYQQVNEQATCLGSGLLALGQKPRENICVFAETRAEWMITALACFKYNFPLVTLYATLGDEAILHGVNESEVEFLITSNLLIAKFKNMIAQMPKLKHIIYMNHGKKPDLSNFPSSVTVHSMQTVLDIGAMPENISTPITKATRDDLAVIMYTSGSTGVPKGVMISNANLLAGMSGQTGRVPGLCAQDTYIGYLPLAHVLELSAEITCITNGCRIGYSSPLTLTDQSGKIKKGSKGDATELQPTLMAAVPVIMDRLYKTVWEKVNTGGPFQQAFFKFAYDYKKKQLERGFDTPILNRIMFKKICQILGGKLRNMLSGGAPMSADTQRFMNICFCCPVVQGYGLTETCGAGTIHEVTDMSTGRVGAPLTCCEIRLVNWEEGGYTTDDVPNPRGEVVIGGANVALGYYKNEEKTMEDFKNQNGQRWFYTGDIGEFHRDGCLKIIDRKKDLVKLNTGEYVSLSKVETSLKMCPLIDNCCVYANSMRDYTVCLIVPNHKQLMMMGEQYQLNTEDFVELCQNPQICDDVMKAILKQAGLGTGKLERFEIPQKIKLVTEAWTSDSGLVTDAFKLKRRKIQEYYQNDIDDMYK